MREKPLIIVIIIILAALLLSYYLHVRKERLKPPTEETAVIEKALIHAAATVHEGIKDNSGGVAKTEPSFRGTGSKAGTSLTAINSSSRGTGSKFGTNLTAGSRKSEMDPGLPRSRSESGTTAAGRSDPAVNPKVTNTTEVAKTNKTVPSDDEFIAVKPRDNKKNHPYINFGVGGYYLHDQDFGVESGPSPAYAYPLFKINNDGFTPIYQAAVGYSFYNLNSSLWTEIFGNQNKLELDLDYFDSKKTERGGATTGALWFIDSGALMPGLPDDTIYNSKLTAEYQNADISLYYRGNKTTVNSALMLHPYFGAVYKNTHRDYDFFATYHISQAAGDDGDDEDYDLKTEYFGIALGNRVDYLFSSQFAAFADIEAQLLRAHADLDVNQNASAIQHIAPSYWVRNITDSATKITYRAKLLLGLNYKFYNKPESAMLSLKWGVDRWGYNPEIVTRSSEFGPSTHLTSGSAENNGVVMLEVHVPIT